MLKFLTSLALIVILSTASIKAQALQGEEQLVTVGLGISSLPKHDFTSKTPSFIVAYQRNISEKIGVGYISVGGLAAFTSSYHDYKVDAIHYTQSNNFSTFAAKGVYHFDMVELTDNVMWNTLDVYAGATLGFTLKRGVNDENVDKVKNSYLAADFFMGARYNFYEDIGVFTEVGYGIAYLKLGISIKF